MSYPALQIANEFIKLGIENNKPITQIHLLKFLYFANAAYLVFEGERLIEEDFLAWEFGPVIREVYAYTRLYGANPIQEEIPPYKDNENIDELSIQYIQETYKIFSNKAPFDLVAITHAIGGAWYIVFNSGSMVEEIEDEDIIAEYKTKDIFDPYKKNKINYIFV